ncbi:GTPase IMAP family member 4-like isoform X3 [Danio rerio]|uniref:GTPase IMAP family member 4-like isoform X3 n=1 Tax=Danio rerio TaxID=7955 RepID=A0AC58JFU6_DANRE
MEASKGAQEPLRLVLLGLQGVGKSAVGNTILNKEEFHSDISAASLTLTSEQKDAVVFGRRVTVVDTPGILNCDEPNAHVKQEVLRALNLCDPGPHAILLVIQLGRFTEQERRVMDTLQKILCSNVNLYTTVLFTYGDKLKNKSLDQFIAEDKNLQNLIQKCGSQYHVFNNTDRENKRQVSELFEKLDHQIGKRSKKYYVRTKREQSKSWKTQYFYIAAAAAAAAVAALFIFSTADKTPIPTQPVAPSALSERVTNVKADVPQNETFWEMMHAILNKDNRGKVYFFGLVPLLFLMRKFMKK